MPEEGYTDYIRTTWSSTDLVTNSKTQTAFYTINRELTINRLENRLEIMWTKNVWTILERFGYDDISTLRKHKSIGDLE